MAGSSDLERRTDSEEARLERLGRERPPCFSSAWSELTFCFSIVMSQILAEYYISGSNILLPTLIDALDIPLASSIWPSTALSLVVTSTLLIFGRLGDMYGGFVLYLFGAGWLTFSSILAGFSQSWLMLVICRALQGLALASFLPSGLMILGSVYRPGPRKNLVFSVYGACAALGFFIGIFFSGLCGRFLSWRWYFFIGAILSAITAGTSYLSIPSDFAERRKKRTVTMDWLGSVLLVPGLVLLVYAIAGSSHAPKQWATAYIDVCLALGVVLLAAFVYVEGWVVSKPLVPGDVFAVKYMKPLLLSLVCLYGSLGIFLLYGALYMQGIMHASPLQIVAWTVPMAVGGLLISTVGGFILHRISGTNLMIISCLGYLGSGLFFALMPENGGYWPFVFPAMICGTIGIDISFNVTNVFITSNLPLEKQGLAGALINCTLHLGIALHLGFADIVQVNTEDKGTRKSYQAVFWFQVALCAVGLVVNALWVRISRAKSELTVDEKRALEASQTD
ncbi:putative MFS multidrug transporter [Aspergillus clavatus NRRL 1]|uniref:MFS multidrug transporter, putative n=1 Tax=Aspergillus clavatus (strain ATCC 1007 / CBS 513.65 / DSM 816 / NCTC 3887 / NRRL 1 / QM 1276 / 107) TaxID=344612 RepID=A1CIV3_ASPCL|nr:MFS multidrug transporter, putative [Aspergillus clavatus NRRL 1]EAW10808.1 MFS multidrug transporter, putative [Aspergillus clavatus NRRL 1]